MERLTQRNEYGRAIFAGNDTPVGNTLRLSDILEKLAEYEDIGLMPEQVKQLVQAGLFFCESYSNGVRDTLERFSSAEKDGRLFITPVKAGDMLYPIWFDEVIGAWGVDDKPERVNEVGSKGFFLAATLGDPEAPDEFHPYDEIGKEFFLTYEEAMEAVQTNAR